MGAKEGSLGEERLYLPSCNTGHISLSVYVTYVTNVVDYAGPFMGKHFLLIVVPSLSHNYTIVVMTSIGRVLHNCQSMLHNCLRVSHKKIPMDIHNMV